MFPKMPQEVFDLWIAPHLEDYGWPFLSAGSSIAGSNWENFFAHRPLRKWADLSWQIIQIDPSQNIFHSDTMWRVKGIIGHCVNGFQTDMANIQNSQQRFRACASWITIHRSLPAPLIGIYDEHAFGFELVDGHHRLAALFHIGFPRGFKIPAWAAMDTHTYLRLSSVIIS
jgi:hypothetical protein